MPVAGLAQPLPDEDHAAEKTSALVPTDSVIWKMLDRIHIDSRYPSLSTIALAFKGFATLIAIAGVIATVLAYKTGGGAAITVCVGLAAAMAVLVVWTAAELICVLVDIETNTRLIALLLQAPPSAGSEDVSERPLTLRGEMRDS